jgi:hypothetical protein
VAWTDTRSGTNNIYGTMVMGDGTSAPAWPGSGFPIAVGTANAELDAIIGDRRGSAIVAWRDNRRGEYDLYAYRLTFDQPVPVAATMVSSNASTDRVEIDWWLASSGSATVERRDTGGSWLRMAEVTPDGTGMVEFVDSAVLAGQHYDYRLLIADEAVSYVSIDVPVSLALSFEGARPNPTSAGIDVGFSLPDERQVDMRLTDVAGRELRRIQLGPQAAGRHRTALTRSGELAPGVYFVEFRAGTAHAARRVAVVR